MIEVVISTGVLAVAVPLVFGALAEGGKSAIAAQAETRGAWIIPACLEEIQASREGRPRYFPATAKGEIFPPAGEVWALAFSADGKPAGRIPRALYQSGAGEIDGRPVRFIACIRSAVVTPLAGGEPLLRADITLEYPAAAGAGRRAKQNFHTLVR